MGNAVSDVLLTVAANHANCTIIFLELAKTFHLSFLNLYLGAGNTSEVLS